MHRKLRRIYNTNDKGICYKRHIDKGESCVGKGMIFHTSVADSLGLLFIVEGEIPATERWRGFLFEGVGSLEFGVLRVLSLELKID